MKDNNGFFAGKNAFSLILNSIGIEDNSNLKSIFYNDFKIIRDDLLDDNTITGVGEPYASIAKEMKKKFSDE